MEINIAEIESKINTSPSGCHAVFVPLTEKWAIKLYRTASSRDKHYNNQVKAAAVGLGPETNGKVDALGIYGYITEIVTPGIPQCCKDDGFYDANNNFYDEYYHEICELVRELTNKIGFYFGDYHAGNVGWKNGKLICIDFGF